MSSVTMAFPSGVMRQPLGSAYPSDTECVERECGFSCETFGCDSRTDVTASRSVGRQNDFAIYSVKVIPKSILRHQHIFVSIWLQGHTKPFWRNIRWKTRLRHGILLNQDFPLTLTKRTFLCFFAAASLLAFAEDAPKRPRLVLAIVIDQFRYDYLLRFRQDYNAGFKRMLEEGAVFTDA